MPSTRIALATMAALFLGLTLVYVNYLIAQTNSTHSLTRHVDSGYLQEQQVFAKSKHNDSTVPAYCACYGDAQSSEPSLPPPSEQPTGDASPLVVPESFAEPSPELVEKINANLEQDRVLIVATANYGMRNHVYNWIESLKRTGETKFLVFCLDDQLYAHLKLAGYEANAATLPESWVHVEIEAGFEEYYSKKYRVITHAKTLIVQQLLYLDVTVLFSDVDIVWMRSRLREYLATFLEIREETDVLFQQEGLDERVINSGFYLMRPTDSMKRLLADTIYLQDHNEGLTQQGAMNKALTRVDMDLRTSNVVFLDFLHFPNGFVYFTHDLPNKHGVEPYVVHANYLVGEDKKRKLQEHGLWYLDDSWLADLDTRLAENSNENSS